MTTISNFLAADHVYCDVLFDTLESLVAQKMWGPANTALDLFNHFLTLHFSMEEDVLFPEFEKATGNSTGPTSVMRLDHQHLRGIISRLLDAITQHDVSDFFDHADTLRIMLQQHNLKEESILYLMADRILSADQEKIIDTMRTVALSDDIRTLTSTE